MSERLVSALFGAFWGALIGVILAWLLGVHSNTLGPGWVAIDAKSWIAGPALVFAALGLIFNVGIGTIVGHVLNAIFEFERADQSNSSKWLNYVVLLAIFCGVL